jgi:hypothetical protein
MKEHKTSLTLLQARTIKALVNDFSEELTNSFQIASAGEKLTEKLEKNFPSQFNSSNHHLTIAFTLATLAKKAVDNGSISAVEYLSIYAETKSQNEILLDDFGAFGDLFEVLVRCAFVKKLSLVRSSMLHVKKATVTDMISKKYGKIEIGHNGKTFTQGTLFDYMAGDFNAVVYGMYSLDDKEKIYDYCINKKYDNAIDYILNYTCFWSDKYTFLHDMDNLSRGKGIGVKGENVQVYYNDGKYNSFQMAIESGLFHTLSEIL